MKRFSELTDIELLKLTNEELNDSIRVEAIERGTNPPITLSEALRRSEWRGYEKPAEAVKLWGIKCGYHSPDCGYLTEAKAEAALEGLVHIGTRYEWGKAVPCIDKDAPRIEVVYIGISHAERKAANFEEFYADTTEFDKVRNECLERFGTVRQGCYNAKVRAEKKAEYLRLASGSEEIAKAFWSKTEGTPWPEVAELAYGEGGSK